METEEFLNRLKTIQEKTTQYRGRIIDGTIQIEGMIESFLAKYFCDDPKKEKYLLSLFIANSYTNFLTKEKVLKFILENEYKAFLQQNPDFLKELGEIRVIRNDLAHSKVNTEKVTVETFDGKTIELFYIKDGKEKTLKLNNSIMNGFVMKINRTMDSLIELLKLESLKGTATNNGL